MRWFDRELPLEFDPKHVRLPLGSKSYFSTVQEELSR